MLRMLHHMTPEDLALLRANPELARAIVQANLEASIRALAHAIRQLPPTERKAP
jgi:hypothetical protein